MLEVTHKGITEPLNKYQGLEVVEELSGNFTLTITSFSHENNPAHELIEEEAIISVDGYDFRIKQLRGSKNRKAVTAISIFYDLVGHRQEEIYGGTRTFKQFADFIFKGTGWTYTSDVSGSALIPNFGDDNVIKLVQGLCAAYECEYKILPGKRVHFAKEIGPDNDAQYRYGHNVKALSKSVDTTNLRTKITGYGGGGLVVTYTSPYADKFPDAGEAEPVKDERFTISENFLERIKRQLTDYPEVSFELDVVELSDKEVGERIWLIYEPMKVEFQTRILSKKSTIRNRKWVTLSVVLGNKKPKTLSDVLTEQRVEIDENAKQTNSRFEQTNERITMEVEAVNESISSLSVEQGRISLRVSNLAENTAAQFEVLENRIESKVDGRDFNGERIMSMIEQTPSYITLSAQKINFDGEVFGSSNARFEGQVRAERIIGNEISGVTLRTSHSSRFIRMEEQQMTLWDRVYDKMHIGFRNQYGSLTQVPYIIMGYGETNGRDKMVIEKDSGYFHMVYSTRQGESSIKMNYSGSAAFRSDGNLYLEARNQITADSTINAPDFNTTSTVKLKDHIKEFEGSASDVINRTNIYTYYLKKDLEDGIYNNPQLGFLAEAATDLKSGDAVSMYKAVAYSWKALQEKSEEMQVLESRIADIEVILEEIV